MAPCTPPAASYAATVRALPRRRRQVSSRACDISGRPPGSPSTSSRRRAVRERSTIRPSGGGGLDDGLPQLVAAHRPDRAAWRPAAPRSARGVRRSGRRSRRVPRRHAQPAVGVVAARRRSMKAVRGRPGRGRGCRAPRTGRRSARCRRPCPRRASGSGAAWVRSGSAARGEDRTAAGRQARARRRCGAAAGSGRRASREDLPLPEAPKTAVNGGCGPARAGRPRVGRGRRSSSRRPVRTGPGPGTVPAHRRPPAARAASSWAASRQRSLPLRSRRRRTPSHRRASAAGGQRFPAAACASAAIAYPARWAIAR